MINGNYQDFLATKAVRAPERGLAKTPEIANHLFPFQAHCVDHHLRIGAAGCYLDTGLGKTEIQLEWCQHALEAENCRALILTPLAVAAQTKRRAERWAYEARVIREQSEAGPGINICNYDRLGKLDASQYGVVSLDEGSILKSFTGKTTRALIETFKDHRFKLVATATPAPNDHMELGQHCEFLSIMPSNEMLMRWFIADQTEMGRYRLKNHAVVSFWDWMASWARMGERPADLGDMETDARFILTPFKVIRHRSRNSEVDSDLCDLFGLPNLSATNLHDVKRQTAQARAETVVRIVEREPAEPWLIWVDTNYEADEIAKVLPDAIEVRGSQSIGEKEDRLEAFAKGQANHLIAKPSMCGFGLDWSHCARMIFAGRSYSYETWYQAVRRCWRFGQERQVQIHLVVAEGEETIGRVIERKADDHADMKQAMRNAMRRNMRQSRVARVAYDPSHREEVPEWLTSVV